MISHPVCAAPPRQLNPEFVRIRIRIIDGGYLQLVPGLLRVVVQVTAVQLGGGDLEPVADLVHLHLHHVDVVGQHLALVTVHVRLLVLHGEGRDDVQLGQGLHLGRHLLGDISIVLFLNISFIITATGNVAAIIIAFTISV